jgi:hypothetical protein
MLLVFPIVGQPGHLAPAWSSLGYRSRTAFASLLPASIITILCNIIVGLVPVEFTFPCYSATLRQYYSPVSETASCHNSGRRLRYKSDTLVDFHSHRPSSCVTVKPFPLPRPKVPQKIWLAFIVTSVRVAKVAYD